MVPPGTNGVQPSASLEYNSQGGNGDLGMGWSLSGLSMISRLGQSIYQDGQTRAVELNANDRFALDGSRLVVKSGTYGSDGTIYATESESFARITSYSIAGVNGTGWFKVEAKDGTIMEYGSTDDSRRQNGYGSIALYWLLKKVTYPDGNYIEYAYTGSFSNPHISEIRYTGNNLTGLAPYNKLAFFYGARTDNNTSYESGIAVTSTELLSSITVYAENQVARTYQLNYGFDNINSYLKEIVEKGSDGSQLNSTIFKYGDIPSTASEFTSGSSSALAGSSYNLSSGDFNADGFTDLLAIKTYFINNQEYNSGFKIFKRSASNTTLTESFDKTFPSNETYQFVRKTKIPNFYNYLSGDFTSDGADDVVAAKVTGSGNNLAFNSLTIYKSNGSATAFAEDIVPSYPNYTKVPLNGRYLFPGDFDGDGIQDVLTILSNNSSYASHIYFGSSPAPLSFKTLGLAAASFTFNDWALSDQIFVLDFNGDGRSDLMVIKDTKCEIYTFDGYNARSIYSSGFSGTTGFPTKDHLIYLGDFNGDRKTDLLVRSSLTSNGAAWTRATSTGTGFSNSPFTFQQLPNITGTYSDNHLTIADYNGDGKTDIYHAYNVTSTTSKLDLYYSRGSSFHYAQYNFNSLIGFVGSLPFDLNGDGRSDLVNRTSYTSPFDIFSFRQNGRENLLEKLANGHNHVTEFTYKRLNEDTDGSFYYQGSLGGGMWNNIKVPMQVVSEMKVQNGIGGNSNVQYSYAQARLHKQGKGLMGFQRITSSDLSMNVRTVAENTFTSYPYAPLSIAPQKTSTYLISDNSLISQTNFYVGFVDYGYNQYDPNKRYWQRIDSTYENKAFEGRNVRSKFTYDSYGNVTQSTANIQNGLEITTTNTTYGQYAAPIPSRPTQTTVSRTRSGQSPFSVTTDLTYNAKAQVTSKNEFAGLPKSVQTSYGYDTFGNVTTTTVSPNLMSSRSVTTTYDSKGRFATSISNPLGQSATASYDDRWGKPLSQTGIDGLTTTYEYDAFGRLKKTNEKVGTFEAHSVNLTYNWDVTGTRIYYTYLVHPGRPDVKTWYDLLGREIRTETEGFQAQWITQTSNYDAKGNVFSATRPFKSGEALQTVTTNFDNYNRPTIITNNAFGTTNIYYAYASGNLTTTTSDPAGLVTTKTNDASGQVVQATDPGGTLAYVYNSQGNLTSVTKSGVTLTSSQFDAYGRQTSLTDQNAGTTTYVYDALGQLTSQTNANGQTTTLAYDIMGRNTSRIGMEGTTSYEYFSNANGASTGRLKKITSFAGNLEEYTYDNLGRIASAKETVDGDTYQSYFGYNIYDDLTAKNYPSGFGIRRAYDANGYPTTIKNHTNTVTLYTNNGLSSHGVNTSYTLGNNQTSTVTHFHGIPLRYLTPGYQDLTMTWNYQNGNLTQRRDNIQGREENFGYDALNRLTTATVVGLAAQTVNYGNIGNIDSKTDAGTYAYLPARPNAVTSVTNPLGVVPSAPQTIAYTAFAQPFTVSENNYQTTYTYGADYERIKSVTTQNGTEIGRRYYFGDYERITEGANTAHIHYISSPAGLIAIVARPLGTSADGIYYTYTDHLGSILRLVRPDASIVTSAEQSFDAWGRRRNPVTWVPLAPTATTGLPYWLIRGYTSHEHLDQFGLINMNGRLYDPALGRVLSADNYVQDPFNTQSYNRYSYVLNNPLSYNDPDGHFWNFVVGGVLGGFSGWQAGRANGAKGWGMVGYIFSGAAIGVATAGVGSAVSAATVSWGAVGSGIATGAVSGFVGGGFNAGLAGGNFLQGAAKGALWGGAIGGALGGIQELANYSSKVKEARRNLMAAGVDPNDALSATNAELNSFVRQNSVLNDLYSQAGQPNMSVATNSNISGGYSITSDGMILTPDGDLAGGVTSPLFKTMNRSTGSIKSEIMVASKQFSRAYRLYMTVGHELNHAIDFNNGSYSRWFSAFQMSHSSNAGDFSRYVSEVKAHSWSYSNAKLMHYNVSHYKGRISFYRSLLPFLPN